MSFLISISPKYMWSWFLPLTKISSIKVSQVLKPAYLFCIPFNNCSPSTWDPMPNFNLLRSHLCKCDLGPEIEILCHHCVLNFFIKTPNQGSFYHFVILKIWKFFHKKDKLVKFTLESHFFAPKLPI